MKCKCSQLHTPYSILYTSYLIIVTLAVTLLSCTHRDIDFDDRRDAYIDVAFNWEKHPDANPSSMSLFLFSLAGDIPYRFDFGGRDGGTLRLTPDKYHAVCINTEERGIAFRGEESHSTFEVYSTESTTMSFEALYSVRSYELPRAVGSEEQTLVEQPPMLWSAVEHDVAVTVPSTNGSYSQITMTPECIVDKYIVSIMNISNIQYLWSLSASMSSMSDGYFIGTKVSNDNSATIAFDLAYDVNTASAEGEFLTFGHCAETDRSHKLMIYAIMSDSNKYYFEYDVTDEIHNEEHDIIIDGLALPNPIGGSSSGDGGFDPTVTLWNEVNVGIKM